MNLYKMGFSAVCVAAAIALSACGGPINDGKVISELPGHFTLEAGQPLPEEINKPPLTDEPGANGVDYLKGWSSDDLFPYMKEVSNRIGLNELKYPTVANQANGIVSVGPLGERCFLAFSVLEADVTNGNLSLAVMSRYNKDLSAIAKDLTVPERGQIIDLFHDLCA